MSIGETYLSRNEPFDALHRYEAALSLIESTGDSALEGAVLAGMGRVL